MHINICLNQLLSSYSLIRQIKAHENYMSCATAAEKREFRTNWAKTTFEHHIRKKRFETSYTRVDKSKGRQLTFGALVQAYGGWEWAPAIVAAKKTSFKCAKLGEPWCEWDRFEELQEYEEIFTKSWQEFEETTSETQKSGGSDEPAVRQGELQDKPTPDHKKMEKNAPAKCRGKLKDKVKEARPA